MGAPHAPRPLSLDVPPYECNVIASVIESLSRNQWGRKAFAFRTRSFVEIKPGTLPARWSDYQIRKALRFMRLIGAVDYIRGDGWRLSPKAQKVVEWVRSLRPRFRWGQIGHAVTAELLDGTPYAPSLPVVRRKFGPAGRPR